MLTANHLTVKKIIADRLTLEGWVIVDEFGMNNTHAVATKDYATAVGLKTAHVALEPRAEGTYQLVGNYQSEGNNALSTTWFLVSEGLSEQDIIAGAGGFADKVDAKVETTYARRLL